MTKSNYILVEKKEKDPALDKFIKFKNCLFITTFIVCLGIIVTCYMSNSSKSENVILYAGIAIYLSLFFYFYKR